MHEGTSRFIICMCIGVILVSLFSILGASQDSTSPQNPMETPDNSYTHHDKAKNLEDLNPPTGESTPVVKGINDDIEEDEDLDNNMDEDNGDY